MPGIVGLITARPPAEAERLLETMIRPMLHEPFYTSGRALVPELRVYAGWVALADATTAQQPIRNEAGDVSLLFSGECFPDPALLAELKGRGHDCSHHPLSWLVHMYEEQGDEFVARLNGIFSGLLMDGRSRRILLFNDRYGFDRIYCHEDGEDFYFASEAAPLLRARPKLREFAAEGVQQYLAIGCTVAEQTLFKGIRLLPAGTICKFEAGRRRQRTYFTPSQWEGLPVLSAPEFQSRFRSVLSRIVPRYFETPLRLGVALTAGLDSRIVLACRPPAKNPPVAYTYGGETGRTLDCRRAEEVARVCGMEHHILRVRPDFFQNFAPLVDTTVRVTSGTFGVLGAHEVYFNRCARELSTVRLTGVFGGEIFREVCTFKPVGLEPNLLHPDVRPAVATVADRFVSDREHPVTFAAFREIPWNIFASVCACRSQVTFRTPYLDNDLVALAYQAPAEVRGSSNAASQFIRETDPALAAVGTDMGLLGSPARMPAWKRLWARATFKLDYLCNDGLAGGAVMLDPLIESARRWTGVVGLHKYLWYRWWFRNRLAGFLQERLSDPVIRREPWWNASRIGQLADTHIRGRRSALKEINAVLTLESIRRQLLAAN